MGEPVQAAIDLEIEVQSDTAEERLPGFGWTMHEETVEALKDIDASIRSAEQLSGSIIFG